ncbi:bacterioferritin-associated ferredoxin [Mycetohabitans sp. B8]|uniref:(2Fe-2S)-binding protein n=1 Tax=Mycetohabitans sp. B8 TaxID=2841845 RepID=UPI001F1852B3|nr:(2Fe-2S)-binding protein [Mycetohabitans sp. B8]
MRLVTVGNAMAGVRTLKAWLKRAPNLYDHAGERVTPLTRLLLRSALNAGSAPPARDKTICNCVGGSERSITDALSELQAGDDLQSGVAYLAHLQQSLGCGTQCGSCIPEVKRLIASAHALA